MTTQEDIQHDNRYRPCLDHGFVGLDDYMGSDAAIVRAARVSYSKGTKAVRSDRGLLRYLLRHKHTTPFEQCVAKFHMRMPIFVARQIVRHRTASINEESARYSILNEEFYIPEVEHVAGQSKTNNQGRGEALPGTAAEAVRSMVRSNSDNAYAAYQELLDEQTYGVARELARMVLPVNIYTEWFWTANLHNIMHFLKLRMDQHAQYEVRVFANAMHDLLKPLFPQTFEAFDDYIWRARMLSRMELNLLSALVQSDAIDRLVAQYGGEKATATHFDMSDREFREFRDAFTGQPGLGM